MSWKLPVIGVSLLLAAAVLTAGAGSAQAANTTICTMSNLSQTCTTPRHSGQVYKAAASGTNAVQTSSGESLSCTGSVIEFIPSQTVGSPLLHAEVPNWTLTGCTDIARPVTCSKNIFVGLPYNMTIKDLGSDHGLLKVTAGSSGVNPTLEYECGTLPVIKCTFETPEIKIETSSLTPAIAEMSALMTQSGGGASCGKESKLVGNYTFTFPSPGSFFVEHD
jgi:hypothetical protein